MPDYEDPQLADKLYEKYGEEMSADYMQLGHHGNNGLEVIGKMLQKLLSKIDRYCISYVFVINYIVVIVIYVIR